MPLEDRAADTWEPLVAVADHAGQHWPDRARHAAFTMTADAADTADTSDRLRLLSDCRTAFADDTALPTTELLHRLRADLESPWREYGPNGLSAMKLGALLREYGIRSATIRFPTGQAKGYHRTDFTDAWTRYTPGNDTPTEDQPYQPYQPQHPSSDVVRLDHWYGSSRTTKQAVPTLTSTNEPGTAGTATPLRPTPGGAA